jgi:hypothetical protein
MKEYKQREITEKIIGAAYKVHNTFGSGFLESQSNRYLASDQL